MNNYVPPRAKQVTTSIMGNFYSIICDEYTGCSNKELLTFGVHWVMSNLNVLHYFLGFYEIPDIKSSTTVSVIKDIMIGM